MNDHSTLLRTMFEEDIRPWGITLPDGMDDLLRGKFFKAGWSIRYMTGHDEQGPFLDYFAAHRMTNDRHVRLRPDGTRENLPTMREAYTYRQGASRREIEAAKAEYYAFNRIVGELLRKKGFVD
jgi:hypothetical protein